MTNKYVNLQFLMRSTKNDVEQVKQFIQDVLELNAVSIGSLNSAFEKNNFIEMKATAHMLKSSADIFDSAVYKQNLVNLEHTCQEGHKEAVGNALEAVSTVAAAWESELREALTNLA